MSGGGEGRGKRKWTEEGVTRYERTGREKDEDIDKGSLKTKHEK